MRDVRHLPQPGALVEITQRTMQGRSLLRPSKRLNALFVGCLAKAQATVLSMASNEATAASDDAATACQIHAVATLSSHCHLLASFATVEHMARFMCHFKTNLSKEIGRLHDWEGSLYAGRYQSVPVSDEPEAQEARLRYILSQGAKEGLVLSPRDWPGVHSARALTDGEPIRGIWVDRSKLYAARQSGKDADERDFTVETELELAPLPCWQGLGEEVCRNRAQVMVHEIERETLAMHEKAGTVPLGVEAVLRRRPHERPNRVARSPKPRFHAASKAVRDLLVNAYREFLVAYRIAAERLAAGDRQAAFPENCYPPRLPFVEPAFA